MFVVFVITFKKEVLKLKIELTKNITDLKKQGFQ